MRTGGMTVMICVLALLAPSIGAADQPAVPATTKGQPGRAVSAKSVDGVIVTAKPDPLKKADKHLAKLKSSLPTMGTDAARKQDVIDKLQRYAAAHSDPNATTGQQRKMMERAAAPPQGPGADGDAPVITH